MVKTRDIRLMPKPTDFLFRRPKANILLNCPGIDQLHGGSLIDRSGNGHDGNIVGPVWELEPIGLWVLHYDGADDYVDFGVIADSVETIFVSLWFKLDALFEGGAAHNMTLWGKQSNGDWIATILNAATGQLVFYMYIGAVWKTTMGSAETSWAGDTWFHVISSKSAANATRMRVNGGAAKTHADKTALPAGGEFLSGNKAIGATTEVLQGELALLRVGLFDLTAAEELFLYEYDRHLLGV